MDRVRAYIDDLLERSTPERPAWNIEALRGYFKPSWNYVDGCMIKGILELFYVTGDNRYLTFADDFIDYHVNEDGSIIDYPLGEYLCDSINEGKVLFDLYKQTGKEKYRLAIEFLYDSLQTYPRTVEGNFWHKKIYPNQVWLDGLYMVQPFYMEYERTFNQNRNYRDIFQQFKNVYELMREPATNLLYHAYDSSREIFWADKKTGLSPHFWTRALGWYAMALVDTLEKMDEQFFYEYQTLQEYLREVLDSLLLMADHETKLFYQVTDMGTREGNYLETSGSSAIAYSLMKGARLKYLPAYYFGYGKDIFDSVLKHKLTQQGNTLVLKDICLVAGLGGMPGRGDYKVRDGSFEYYISEPVVDNDAKGAAPFLMAYTEVCRSL